jgi:hypothetical protein
LGPWGVLVLNHWYLSTPGSVASTPLATSFASSST